MFLKPSRQEKTIGALKDRRPLIINPKKKNQWLEMMNRLRLICGSVSPTFWQGMGFSRGTCECSQMVERGNRSLQTPRTRTFHLTYLEDTFIQSNNNP